MNWIVRDWNTKNLSPTILRFPFCLYHCHWAMGLSWLTHYHKCQPWKWSSFNIVQQHVICSYIFPPTWHPSIAESFAVPVFFRLLPGPEPCPCALAVPMPTGSLITPLHPAAEENYAEICQLLLSARAKVDPRNRRHGAAPLYLAACLGEMYGDLWGENWGGGDIELGMGMKMSKWSSFWFQVGSVFEESRKLSEAVSSWAGEIVAHPSWGVPWCVASSFSQQIYFDSGTLTSYQWEFQDPKMEVPTINIRPIFQAYASEYPQKIWSYMVLTYLHFRIRKFPFTSYPHSVWGLLTQPLWLPKKQPTCWKQAERSLGGRDAAAACAGWSQLDLFGGWHVSWTKVVDQSFVGYLTKGTCMFKPGRESNMAGKSTLIYMCIYIYIYQSIELFHGKILYQWCDFHWCPEGGSPKVCHLTRRNSNNYRVYDTYIYIYLIAIIYIYIYYSYYIYIYNTYHNVYIYTYTYLIHILYIFIYYHNGGYRWYSTTCWTIIIFTTKLLLRWWL